MLIYFHKGSHFLTSFPLFLSFSHFSLSLSLSLSHTHTHSHCMHTAGSLRQSTKWWLKASQEASPSLAPATHGARSANWENGEMRGKEEGGEAGKVWLMHTERKRKRCGRETKRGRMRGTKKVDRREESKLRKKASALDSQASDSFLQSDVEEKSWLGQNARTGWRGGEGGGYYKNVKSALQPFSQRSAGGH